MSGATQYALRKAPMTRWTASAFSLALVLAACSSAHPPAAGDAPPAARCKMPGPLPPAAMFTEITAQVGLGQVQGTRVSAVDLDNDGWTDLVFHSGGTVRDNPPTLYVKRVFMNHQGTFVDATAESGMLDSRDGPGTGRLSELMLFGDVDNDGDLDAFSPNPQNAALKPPASNDVTEVMLNDGKGHFTFADPSDPSKARLTTSSATFVDYDRDGNLDVLVGTTYDATGLESMGNHLYQGGGDASFADVSKETNVLRPAAAGDQLRFVAGEYRRAAFAVTSCDIDNDGDPDLLLSAYGREYNELWRNDNGKFTDIAPGTPFAADDNLSYKTDNEFYHCWCKAQPAGTCPPEESSPKVDCTNFSWTPGFDDQPARLGGNNFSTACGDLDNDGDMDVIHSTIVHWHIGQSADPSQILRNDLTNGTPTFVRSAGFKRAHPISDWNDGDLDVAMFDFDNDGKKDVYLGSSDYPETYGTLWQQQADGSLADITDAAGVRHYHAHGFAVVDIDRDGDLDLVVTTSPARCTGDPKCGDTTVRVYRNDVGSTRNFTQVLLHGLGAGKANASAIGARVSITAGGVTQVQEVGGGFGVSSTQNDFWLTFGLGGTCAIDKIEVRWPDASASTQTFMNVVSNYRVEITQGSDKLAYRQDR